LKKAAQKYALALASGARRLEVDYVLKKAKIRDIFSAIVSAMKSSTVSRSRRPLRARSTV